MYGGPRRLAFRVGCAVLCAAAWLSAGVQAQSPAQGVAPLPLTESAPVEPSAPPAPKVPAPVEAAQPAPLPPAPAAATAEALPAEPEPLSMAESESSDSDTLTLKYLLERVEVRGNARVKKRHITGFVPFDTGHAFSVDDPEIEALRYRLLGTGWFDRVNLHLERGRERGWVVLVIDVEERSTLVFQQLAVGAGWSVEGAKGKNAPTQRTPEPYLGLALADTNFLGTGKSLGGELLLSRFQQGVALSFVSPVERATHWVLRTRASFVSGHEYFGGDRKVRVSVQCLPDELDKDDLDKCEKTPPAAVVDYYRGGLSLGAARDVGSFTRLSLDLHSDIVRVPPWGMPVAASEVRGRNDTQAREPIDFSIERYTSYVFMFTLGYTYDKRDSAILPSRGTLAGFTGDFASRLIGSDYDFVRLQLSANHWKPLPWGHVLRVGIFGGAVFGYAPFFYKFFVTDLTDLQPSRILGLNLDHRPAPNLFGVFQCGKAYDTNCGTAIAQMRQESLAARIDAEYTWPLVRGRRKFLKNADIYALVGLYALADPGDLRVSIPGYKGIAKLPIDMTADIGARLDTQLGVFQIGLAKLFWLPVQ